MQSKKTQNVLDLSYIALIAALCAICAWISVPTPVPFTMQTFGIFCAGGLLGARRGSAAVLIYILLGAIGLPVFSNMTGGLGVLLGKTGGYMLGFVFIVIIEGWVADKFVRRPLPLFLSMLAGMSVCYAFGTAWFMYVYASASGAVGLWTVLTWCVFPFIIPDIVKMLLALTLIRRVSPLLRRG